MKVLHGPPAETAVAQVQDAPAIPAAPEPPPPVAPVPAPVAAKPVRAQRQPVQPEPAPQPVEPPAAVLPPSEPPPAPSTPPAPTEPEQVTPAPPPTPPLPEPHTVTLNAGLLIPVRLVDGLSTERNAPGDTFTATLDKELVVDGFVIGERGARVEGRVVAADRGGKVKGVAALAVELTRLHTSDGQAVAIETDSFERHAQAGQRQDAEKVGGATAVGAIIGAITGGGKGSAIGAGVGAGAGAGDVLLTRGQPATLPSETRLSFRLRAPVTITEKTN